jgi:paraquat-inducible protein A
MSVTPILVCNQCDLVQHEAILQPGEKARCARCENVLYRSLPNGFRLSLIFAITSLALFLISNSFPIVTISSQGLINSTTLLGAVGQLIEDGIASIAVLVFITTFLMPMLEIGVLIYLLLPLHLGRIPPGLSFGFRLICLVKPWAMIEVFMIGLIVTITKLNGLASVSPDIGLISFVLLMISITVAVSNFDVHAFWRQVGLLQQNGPKAA